MILQGDNEQEFSFESNKSKLKILRDGCKVCSIEDPNKEVLIICRGEIPAKRVEIYLYRKPMIIRLSSFIITRLYNNWRPTD